MTWGPTSQSEPQMTNSLFGRLRVKTHARHYGWLPRTDGETRFQQEDYHRKWCVLHAEMVHGCRRTFPATKRIQRGTTHQLTRVFEIAISPLPNSSLQRLAVARRFD